MFLSKLSSGSEMPQARRHPCRPVVMENAGASAQRQHDLWSANRRKRVRRLLPYLVLGGVCLGIACWAVAEYFLPGSGPWVGLLVSVFFVVEGVPSRQPVDAWAIGAAGERKTAKRLEKLDSRFRILHDRRIKGRKWNIDHVVVGPTGVFVIETKNVKGRVAVKDGHLLVGGRKKDKYGEEAWREAQAVQEVLAPVMASLGQGVHPILCFHKAELPWGKTSVQSVPIVGGSGLSRHLAKKSEALTLEQVQAIAAFCDHALPRA